MEGNEAITLFELFYTQRMKSEKHNGSEKVNEVVPGENVQ